MDQYFVTPSGLTIEISADQGWANAPQGDFLLRSLTVSSIATTRQITLELDEFMVPANVKRVTGEEYDSAVRDDLAALAVLQAMDEDPDLAGQSSAPYKIRVDADEVEHLLMGPRLTDREIRRYLARRIYDTAMRGTLRTEMVLRDLDVRITGSTPDDIIRNAQILEEEGYIRQGIGIHGQPPSYLATAKLMRDLERYGSAREDAITAVDYQSQLASIDSLEREAILLEYHRYMQASRIDELASVFRALAPLVERMLRSRLQSMGASRDLTTLGRMIGELKSRNLGDLGLVAMLNHVLKFGRDLEQHGTNLPESVLRIACANAFELIPMVSSI